MARLLLNAKTSKPKRIEKLAYEELTMKTQKKSLLSNLKTTRKAIVASNSADGKPNVVAPIAARTKANVSAYLRGHVVGYVAATARR